MSFSDYLENKILDHVFKGTVFTQPANLYVALFTAGPNDVGGGTEVNGGGVLPRESKCVGYCFVWRHAEHHRDRLSEGYG